MLVIHELLETLCCPVAKSPLRSMTKPELEELNTAIAQGRARYAGGPPVADALDGGLTSDDGASVYGIQNGVPGLLPTLRITSSGDTARQAADKERVPVSGSYDDRWEEISQRWHKIGRPQRPSRQDIELLQCLVAESVACTQRSNPRALMLGVTPEIATMRWPAGTRILALDASPGMIRNVWPAREVPGGVAVLADWAAMPVRDAAYDLAVGDGFLTSLPYPDGFRAVVAELRRVLKDDAMFAMREFARPEEREPLGTVFADLREGRMVDLGAFIWRLAIAVHGDLESGCRRGDVWDAWHDHVPDPPGLMTSLGWPLEALGQLEPYRGNEGRMLFPTPDETRAVFLPDFDQVECLSPDSADADRYPTVVFRPRPRRSSHRRTSPPTGTGPQ